MFLVEREPGNVAVYNSTADLTQAIRGGVVGPEARIYHRRSSQWLPITEHPSFRQAKAEAEREPLPPLRRKHWTFLPGATGSTAQPSGDGAQTDQGPAVPADAPSKPRRRWWPDSLRSAVARIGFGGRTERS
jgi:hypothetical protein